VVLAHADPGEKTPVLGFWAGPGAKEDKRVVEIDDHHACSGQRAYARVSRMPVPNSKGSLQRELVVELSRSGGVVRRWPMPVDEIVLGVRGIQIVVPYRDVQFSDEKVLLISSDRSFSIAPAPLRWRSRPPLHARASGISESPLPSMLRVSMKQRGRESFLTPPTPTRGPGLCRRPTLAVWLSPENRMKKR
jgi:hypothetical protein